MKCKGNFTFKQIKKMDAGSFTNDKGETINFQERYKLKVDEVSENGIDERVFNIAIDNTELLNSIKNIKPYDKITIEFDVQLYNNSVRIKPLYVTLIK